MVSDIFVYTRHTKDKRPDKESTMSMEELRRECVGYFIENFIGTDQEDLFVCIGRGGTEPTLPGLRKTLTKAYMVISGD